MKAEPVTIVPSLSMDLCDGRGNRGGQDSSRVRELLRTSASVQRTARLCIQV